MSNVQFDENRGYRQAYYEESIPNSPLMRMAMKFGAKNYRQAQLFLVILSMLFLVGTILVWVSHSSGAPKVPLGTVPPGLPVPKIPPPR